MPSTQAGHSSSWVLYDALATIIDLPVVAVNRAVAVAETRGPAAGLAALDAVAEISSLARASNVAGT